MSAKRIAAAAVAAMIIGAGGLVRNMQQRQEKMRQIDQELQQRLDAMDEAQGQQPEIL